LDGFNNVENVLPNPMPDPDTNNDAGPPDVCGELLREDRQIVHDLGNLLLVISCATEQLLGQTADEDPRRIAIMTIREASEEISRLTRRLRRPEFETPSGVLVAAPSCLTANEHFDEDFDIVEGSLKSVGTETRRAENGSAKTVLLVEDQESLRGLLIRALESHGYQVLGAQHGPEAMSLALRHPGRIDLVVTDVDLPEMTGFELVSELRQEFGGLPAILISGHCDRVLETSTNPGMYYLQKPFRMSVLLAKVKEVLDIQQKAK
jgi:CheY-like chemotaxis protein